MRISGRPHLSVQVARLGFEHSTFRVDGEELDATQEGVFDLNVEGVLSIQVSGSHESNLSIYREAGKESHGKERWRERQRHTC